MTTAAQVPNLSGSDVELDDQPPVPYAKPGPYTTTLPGDQEQKFQGWVKQNKVPWQDSPTADYDMRGYWKAQQSGDANAKQKQSDFDGKMHFPDTYKTPYHKTFSNESIYATPDAPRWNGDRLVDKSGKVIADETPSLPQLSSADVEIEHPAQPLAPKAAPLQTAVARANIAQYPENQQAPDPAYLQRKNAFEAVQGEPGAPQRFEEDPEQERRIRAQQQVQSSQSIIPQAVVPALQAFQTHVNEPLERMYAAGSKYGARVGEAAVSQPAESNEFITPDPRVAGVARGAGSVIGGMVADPRMWPFFLAGPETAPALRAASGYGFAGQMAQGAYEQAGELGTLMGNPDASQEDKWEAGANFVLSAIMAGHGAGSALAGEFMKLPAQDRAEITERIREKEPDVAAQIDQAQKSQQAATPNLTAADVEIDNGKASQPERFRLPKDTSAAEVQGPVKGPNIRTVQVGDKTYAFDQRKINADGVKSAVERGELWRLSGGKAPEAAKVQAETDLKGEEPTTQNPTTNEKPKQEVAPQLTADQVEHEEPQPATAPQEAQPQPERRTDTAQRKRVADLTPDERAKELLTSDAVDLPNKRAFEEKQQDQKSPAVAMSDADGLKAFNDKFGYEAGSSLLRAKAESLKEAGLDAYHDKGDEFLHRGESEGDLRAKLEHARESLRNKEFTVTDATGRKLTLKGVDFSYGTGSDLAAAESGLKSHKSEREARGERARGELRGITETGPQAADHGRSEEVKASQEPTPKQQATNGHAPEPGHAGEMERESPLFRDSEASGQGGLFGGQSDSYLSDLAKDVKNNEPDRSIKGKNSERGFVRPDLLTGIGKPEKAERKPAATFFSKAEEAAKEKLPNSVKADAVIPTLKAAGVKDEELKWLGLSDYLNGKEKVSKQDILDHIKQNNVQVKEVMKGNAEPLAWADYQAKGGNHVWTTNQGKLQYSVEQVGDKFHASADVNGPAGKLDEQFGSLAAAQRWINEVRKENGAGTKFSNYQLPGGENYRELLLTLPSKLQTQAESIGASTKGLGLPNDFRSSHFDEPNVLAHVRFNDRVSPDGKKTLFMEELQSDWHQKGRKQGYQQTAGEKQQAVDALIDHAKDILAAKHGERPSNMSEQKAYDTVFEENKRTQAGPPGQPIDTPTNRILADYNRTKFNDARVPDAPFKSTWHELAMKRMLRYAAENGYDKLAWTTGDQQAQRYDLSKHVSSIAYDKRGSLMAEDHNGKVVIDKPNVKPEELADYIGKDVAAKLLALPETKGERKLSGLDLKVGGSGMKGFYDKILPDFANKYGKKWGAKVGETELGTDRLTARGAYEGPTDTATLTKLRTLVNSDNWRVSESAKAVLKRIDSGESFDKAMDVGNEGLARELGGKYEFKSEKLPVHSIDITPSMRDDVTYKGQVLYSGLDPVAAGRAISQTVKDANGVIKKGSDLYHGAVDKLLDKVHMGNTRPEIRQFDPDAADLATKMDAGGQYHKAVAEMIGKKVSGPLSEEFNKGDTYAERQKKNDISRDRMKGFHFLADAQNREWLKENRPDDFTRWSNDPKIKAAIEAYKPFEEQLRQAVNQLGGKTINEDYIKRIMDFATSGIAYEGKEGTQQGRPQARNGGGRDNVVSPQMDRSKSRVDQGQFYWDHGVFDFGPSFEKRWVEVMSKLDEHRLAVHAMSMGTRIAPDEESPDKVFYNGQEFYRPDVAREIREVQKRGVSSESKELANALGVSELPAPGKVREYGNYEPLRRGSRFETAARNLAANVLAGKEDLAGQAANLSNMAKLKYALPKEIVEALKDAGREKEQGAFSKMATKVLGPLTQFIRQQIVGLGYGIPHMANIMRKVVQSHTGAALNPMGWADAFKVAFSKELKARGISGTEDPMYNMLLKNAAMSEGAIPEYKHYIEGNFDKDNWKETFGNAFRKGGKAAGEITPASAAAGVGRLAIEPLNRFSEAGHKNLFQSGGIDQRARIWLGDFLKDRYPKMSENGIANTVNQTLGRYNRASWTDVQKGLGPLMLFPGWDYSSMTYALKHPFKTAVAPALLMLMANSAVRSLGGNKKDDEHDLERIHVGKYSARANILNDNMGTHLWGWALRGGKAVLDHKNAKDVTGAMVKGVPGDVAGVTTGTLNPILSTPIQVGANRVSPGRQDEITKPGDFHKKGKILPNKAAEDYADFGARRLFPIYDRATQAGQRPSVASFAGMAGVSVTEKKKKK